MARVLVVADIAGHARSLKRVLGERSFLQPGGGLQEDCHLVLAGDLVHRGPRSREVLELALRWKSESPERVSLLLGNHEANYLRANTEKFGGFTLEPRAVELLYQLFQEDFFQVAVGVEASSGEALLVTHAGVTREFLALLQCGESLPEVVAALNALSLYESGSLLWRPGEMLLGAPTPTAGPLWASSQELAESWLRAEREGFSLPYSQAHGHSSPYSWQEQTWWLRSPELIARTQLSFQRKHSRLEVAGSTLWGVDPGHGARPVRLWEPLGVEGTVLSR